jgi:hypothetical protein
MHPYRRHRIRRGIRIAIAAAAGLLLLTAIGLVIEVAAGPHPKGSTQPPPVPDLFSGYGQTPAPAASSAGPAPAGPMQVLQGRELVNGVYLGYPRTSQGAVSAAVEFMRDIGSTLDPDRTAAILRLTADPSYPQAPQQFAQGTITTRTLLGLAGTGLVPAGTSVVLQPAEYQVKDVTASQVEVLLLADYDVTLPGQGTQAKTGIYPLGMHWAEGDWKILPPETTVDYSSLLTQPGTAQAAADGWQELQP